MNFIMHLLISRGLGGSSTISPKNSHSSQQSNAKFLQSGRILLEIPSFRLTEAQMFHFPVIVYFGTVEACGSCQSRKPDLKFPNPRLLTADYMRLSLQIG